MLPSNELGAVIHEWSEVFMRRSGHDFKSFMSETGLSFSQVGVLMGLAHAGRSGVSKLGDQMGVTNAGASQAVDRLVRMGLIERTEDPADRRAKRLALTPKGRTIIEQGIVARSRFFKRITEALTPEQQSMIIASLRLLTEAARQAEE